MGTEQEGMQTQREWEKYLRSEHERWKRDSEAWKKKKNKQSE